MKKLIVLLVVCMLFTGCTTKKPVVTNKNLDVDEIAAEIIDFASSKLSDDGFYYIGTGITVTDLSDEGKTVKSDIALYPVYADEEMCGMLLAESAQSITYINDLNVEEGKIKNNLIIMNNGNAYLIDESGEVMPVRKKADNFNNKVLEKIELQRNINNQFGNSRRLIKSSNTVTDPESGRKYSSSRLVVKFTEGDTDKKIADFEQFCNGKLRNTIKSIGLYIFEIEASNYKKLSYLVNQARQLDYVIDANLDEQRDAYSTTEVNQVDR